MNDFFQTLEWAVMRFVQLIPLMIIFGFIGHALDKAEKESKNTDDKKK